MAWRALVMGTIAVLAGLAAVPQTAASQEVFHPGIDCYCRGPGGQNYPLKARVCLRGAQGDRIATCVMSSNVTSWEFSDEPCEVSALEPAADPAPYSPLPRSLKEAIRLAHKETSIFLPTP